MWNITSAGANNALQIQKVEITMYLMFNIQNVMKTIVNLLPFLLF